MEDTRTEFPEVTWKNLLKIEHKDHLGLENPRDGLETMCASYKETLTLGKQEKFCFIPKCSFMKA